MHNTTKQWGDKTQVDFHYYDKFLYMITQFR